VCFFCRFLAIGRYPHIYCEPQVGENLLQFFLVEVFELQVAVERAGIAEVSEFSERFLNLGYDGTLQVNLVVNPLVGQLLCCCHLANC